MNRNYEEDQTPSGGAPSCCETPIDPDPLCILHVICHLQVPFKYSAKRRLHMAPLTQSRFNPGELFTRVCMSVGKITTLTVICIGFPGLHANKSWPGRGNAPEAV